MIRLTPATMATVLRRDGGSNRPTPKTSAALTLALILILRPPTHDPAKAVIPLNPP